MAPRTHLFFALSNLAFGEVSLAIRLCWQLHARGDRIIFLTPSGLSVLFTKAPFKHGVLDKAWTHVGHLIATVVAEQKIDTVFVVDAASLYLALGVMHADDSFLARLPCPVVAFDVWNLPETSLTWDTGHEVMTIAPAAQQFTRRLVPVPFVRPEAVPGRYNALPNVPVGGALGARAAGRAELGLDDDALLVLTTTAGWQTKRAGFTPYHLHLLDAVPPVLVEHFAALPARARVLHVGPVPLDGAHVLGSRYRWHAQMPGERMSQLLAASDVLVTTNAPATTITTAIALGLPTVLLTNAITGATPEALASALPFTPEPAIAARLAALAPLYPFAAWPLGLAAFLEPVLRDNPYLDAIRRVELLDQAAVVRAIVEVAQPGAERDAQQDRIRRYREEVERLPSALDAMDRLLQQ